MLTKRNKILIIIFSVIAMFAILWVNFAKGTLAINAALPVKNIQVGSKIYDLSNQNKLSLPVGFHKVKTNCDYYQNYEQTLFIGLWSTKNVDINLSLTSEGEQAVQTADEVTKIYADFSKSKDSAKFLNAIKKYVDTDTYSNLKFEIEDSIASQGSTTPTDLPVVSTPVKNSYLETVDGETVATSILTKTNDVNSLERIRYAIKQSGGGWIITNIIYN